MELIKDKRYVTAKIDKYLIDEIHIGDWFKPGLPLIYERIHSDWRSYQNKATRKHIVRIHIEPWRDPVSFWVYECAIAEACMWHDV